MKTSMPVFFRLARPILRTPLQGADTIVWWVAGEEAQESGRFWFDRAPAPEHITQRTRGSDAGVLLQRVLADTDGFLESP